MAEFVNFSYSLQDEDDSTYTITELANLTLQEFRARVQVKHHLQGDVVLSYNGRHLTNLMAALEDVIIPHVAMQVSSDKEVTVASGGAGIGANAFSDNGGIATVEGGFGTGGSYKDGNLRAGRGIGGDGIGSNGNGGEGFGGTAAMRNGDTDSGRGTSGASTVDKGTAPRSMPAQLGLRRGPRKE